MSGPQQAVATKATVTGDQTYRLDRILHPIEVKTSSPRFPLLQSPWLSPAHRCIGIAVDLSDESAFAVRWAVDNYIRPRDVVILIHVNSTSVLYGADWGSSTPTAANPVQNREFDNFTGKKANHVAQPLVDAAVPFKIHIVKDHDMKERLCLEVERLGLSTVIMGSRGIGGSRRRGEGKLGSVSDYCVQHCVRPVVVVRYNQEEKVAEEESDDDMQEFYDANDFRTSEE